MGMDMPMVDLCFCEEMGKLVLVVKMLWVSYQLASPVAVVPRRDSSMKTNSSEAMTPYPRGFYQYYSLE